MCTEQTQKLWITMQEDAVKKEVAARNGKAKDRPGGPAHAARRWESDFITEFVDGDRAWPNVQCVRHASGRQPAHSADTVTVQMQTKTGIGFIVYVSDVIPFH